MAMFNSYVKLPEGIVDFLVDSMAYFSIVMLPNYQKVYDENHGAGIESQHLAQKYMAQSCR